MEDIGWMMDDGLRGDYEEIAMAGQQLTAMEGSKSRRQ
jgi:hypothetical protein